MTSEATSRADTLAQELAANPFLRTGSVARLAEIRAAKDSFR
jgi:hypothetical protein